MHSPPPYERNLLTSQEWPTAVFDVLLERTAEFKEHYQRGRLRPTLRHKTLLLFMDAPSTRTRISLEAAMTCLGGHAQFVEFGLTRAKDGEALSDIAAVSSRYAHVIGVRPSMESVTHRYGDAARIVQEFAQHSVVPVMSLADDMFHPTQAISDVFTLREQYGDLLHKRFVIMWTYAPYPRALSSVHADLLMMTRYGLDVTICRPNGFDVDPRVMKWAEENAARSGGAISVSNDPVHALTDADIVFPRNWTCLDIAAQDSSDMRRERELAFHQRHRFWTLTEELMSVMRADACLMHVLPIMRGYEATDPVIDGPRSILIRQAENRLYVNMALLDALVRGVI